MISITDINLPFPLICLLLLYTVCCEEIKSGSAGHLSEIDFHIIFRSTFNKDNLLIHHYVCYFVCFSENRINLLWLNFPKKNASSCRLFSILLAVFLKLFFFPFFLSYMFRKLNSKFSNFIFQEFPL